MLCPIIKISIIIINQRFLARSSTFSNYLVCSSVIFCGRRERSTVHQVTLLTQKIEDNFSAKEIAGAVFVNLITAFDTVWQRGLMCKLLRLLPDRHMVTLIMELFLIEVFPSSPVPENKTGYDTLRVPSHRDQSWLHSRLISIHITCQ